jgi:hypothetical protein
MAEDDRLERISRQKNKLQGWLNEFEDQNALDLAVLALSHNFLSELYNEVVDLHSNSSKEYITGTDFLKLSVKILRNEIVKIENIIAHENNSMMQ